MKNRIKEFRAKMNLTQEEIAKKANVRRETIVFLEKGKYNPSLKLAHEISKALETRIEELFIFDENKQEGKETKENRKEEQYSFRIN